MLNETHDETIPTCVLPTLVISRVKQVERDDKGELQGQPGASRNAQAGPGALRRSPGASMGASEGQAGLGLGPEAC